MCVLLVTREEMLNNFMAQAVGMPLRIRSRESYNLGFFGDSECLFCLVSSCYVTALSSPGCLHRIAGIIC